MLICGDRARKKKSDILDCVKDFYATVIPKRRASHRLKDFIIQSDRGECKSETVKSFIRSVGGLLRTCCAYTTETMAFIEKLRGIINSMATAMLLDECLSTAYWEYAQKCRKMKRFTLLIGTMAH